MKHKIVRREKVDTQLLSLLDIPERLKEIYIHRGITQPEELDKGTNALLNPRQMNGLSTAVDLLYQAIETNQRIIIVGDFDADGATSCAVCLLALKMLGFENVDYLVPNRFEDGYGLSPEVVDQARLMQVELLITVDNGISSIEGVAYAKSLGLTVIVTDHHLPGEKLPNADAIVNPNLPNCQFASKSLAGVGVAFYLMLALRAKLKTTDYFNHHQIQPPNLADLLDLVALGTVADVVPLDKNNRILVHQGLQRIRAGKVRPGILALIEVAKRNPKRLTAADFGFALGPRLNAAGRLEDMSFGVEVLICQDIYAARRMAVELDRLNLARREIEADMKQEAMAYCERLLLQDNQLNKDGALPLGISLYQADWHQGVIGILASRIKDEFYRPVVVFADADDTGDMIKGSSRSIAGFHMRDALERLDTQNSGLILKFGGHAMAAGLTIPKARFAEFSQKFADLVGEMLSSKALEGEILSDGELLAEEFHLATAQMIRNAGPWGQAFPEPIFDGVFKIHQQKLVAEKHLKLILEPLFKEMPTGILVDAIAFNIDLREWPNASVNKVKLAYRLDVNEFRGEQSLQLMVELIEAVG